MHRRTKNRPELCPGWITAAPHALASMFPTNNGSRRTAVRLSPTAQAAMARLKNTHQREDKATSKPIHSRRSGPDRTAMTPEILRHPTYDGALQLARTPIGPSTTRACPIAGPSYHTKCPVPKGTKKPRRQMWATHATRGRTPRLRPSHQRQHRTHRMAVKPHPGRRPSAVY